MHAPHHPHSNPRVAPDYSDILTLNLHHRRRRRVYVSFLLLFVICSTWLLRVLSINVQLPVIQYLFAASNSFQGLVFLLAFCVVDDKVNSCSVNINNYFYFLYSLQAIFCLLFVSFLLFVCLYVFCAVLCFCGLKPEINLFIMQYTCTWCAMGDRQWPDGALALPGKWGE